jgi:hypothetical protein
LQNARNPISRAKAFRLQHLHKTVNDTNLVELLLSVAFRSLKLDFNDFYDRKVIERNKAVLTLLNQPDEDSLRAGVHEIDISYSDPLDDLCRTEVERLLLRTHNLKALRHLERRNPSAKIHYSMPFSKLNDISPNPLSLTFSRRTRRQAPTQAEIEALQSIIGSTSLHSLEATVMYGSFANQGSMRLVFEALSTCPNVKVLDLSITKPQLPHAAVHGQPDSFDFHSNPHAKFPALEVLKLHGYNLDSTSNAEWEEVK